VQQSSTIDPAEVTYYDRLAHAWWDDKGKFWPLHRLNSLREIYLRDRICIHFELDNTVDKPLQGLTVLDIGCGGGILSESMARMGASVTGIDIVSKSIDIASQHSLGQQLDIEYIGCTAEDLAVHHRQFDVVLNMEVVEHVVELPTFMKSCADLLKPEGITFVATINRNPLSWIFAIIGAEYILRWLPRGTHQWSKFVKPRELSTLLADNGLRIRAETGVGINPFNKRFSLIRSLRVNYMLAATSSADER